MVDHVELARLRLAAQRLVGEGLPTPAAAVRWLTAVQGQDLPGALTSVALRTASRSVDDVRAALDDGSVVRSWPMRGTLHLVAAEDLSWMVGLLAPRVLAGTRSRMAALGLTAADVEQAAELATAALAGGRQLRRADLFSTWDAGGLSTSGQRGVHLLGHLAMRAVLVLGPMDAKEQLVVLADEWIPQPRRMEQEEALGELALRYFRSHGPATAADLARWAGLVMGDVRTGIALARPQLATLDVEGAEHLLDPRTPDLLAAAQAQADGVVLLPGFDEFVLGYRDRSAQLDPTVAERIVPGGNGMFRATVVSGGRVVGTWRRTGRKGAAAFEATPFTPLGPDVEASLPAAFADLP